jgi:hypothetical protein
MPGTSRPTFEVTDVRLIFDVPFCVLALHIEDLERELNVTAPRFWEPGLGPCATLYGRLLTGEPILLVELEHICIHSPQGHLTIHVEAQLLVESDVETLLCKVLAGLGTSRARVLWLWDESCRSSLRDSIANATANYTQLASQQGEPH